MKKRVLFLLLTSTIQFGYAQAPTWIWAENSNGGDWENGVGLSIDTANHLYLDGRNNGTVLFGGGNIPAGCSYSNSPFCGEMDTAGHAIWYGSYDYSCNNDYTEGFGRDNYDNTYATGIIGSNCCGMFVEKYNASGTLRWPLPLGSNSGSSGLGVAADNQGNVYVCGTMSNGTMSYQSINFTYPGSSQSIILLKLDSNGNAIWGKCIYGAGSADGDDQARDIIVDNKGYIYIIGDYSGQPVFGTDTVPACTANKSFFLAKYDTAGNEIWVNTVSNAWANDDFGGTSGEVIDSCGNLYVTGLYTSTANFGGLSLTSSGGQDMFVARSDNNGNWQWVQSAGGTNNDQGQAIAIDKNSDIYVAGYSNSGGLNFGNGVSTSSGDIFVVKYSNGNGAAQWAQSATANSGVGAITVDRKKYVYVYGSIGGGSATFGKTTLTLSSTQNLVLAKLDTVASRTIIPVINSSYCPGSTSTIPYTLQGAFNSGNVFTVQLSDSTGSFVDDTDIGSVTSNSNGTINITIPANTPPGSNYLIRVVSSSPAASSYANGCGAYFAQNVYPNDFYVSIGSSLSSSIIPADTLLCSGGSVRLSVSATGLTYKWYSNTDTSSLSTTDTFTVSPTITTTYYVAIGNGSCSGLDSSVVTVGSAGTLTINVTPLSKVVCSGTSATLMVDSNGTNYNWTPSTGLTVTTGDSIIASPSVATTYTVTGDDSLGCAVTNSVVLTVDSTPTLPVSPVPNPLFCSGLSSPIWVDSGSNFTWTPTSGLSATTGDTVIASPLVTTTYTVMGNDAYGCATTGSITVSVIPSPNKPTFYQHGDTLTSSAATDNQWYMNGMPINGATSQNLIINNTSPDSFFVAVVSEANGCSSPSDTVATTGINQLSFIGNQLSIYPNPFNNDIFINISSSALNVKDWSLQVIDVLGQTVYSRQSLNYSNDIDLSNLPSGVYFITVINKTVRAVFPIVKQN